MVTAARRATALHVLLAILTSCGPPVDPDDVYFFAEAASYLPAGLLCGLAYEGGYGQHMGGSCRGDYDPALGVRTTESIQVAEGRREDAPCPSDFSYAVFNDRDAPSSAFFGNAGYATCASTGNERISSANPRDLPAGAVCGVAGLRSLDDNHFAIPCEGVDPSEGTCPDGYELRWIPDAFTDGTNYISSADPGTCLPDGSLAIDSGAIAVFFCAVRDDVGCTSGDCFDASAYEGVVCGLHARDSWPEYLDQEEIVWEHPTTRQYSPNLYEHFLNGWFEPCASTDEALAAALP